MPKRITGKEMESNTNYVWDIYQETPNMSTYLIAFSVMDNFTSIQKQVGNRNITSWVWAGVRETPNKIPEINLNTTVEILPFFEKYFNMKDELPKIDSMHAMKGPYGAMENWGLIVYWSTYFGVIDLIAHELAHFWVGNLVTCKNWDEYDIFFDTIINRLLVESFRIYFYGYFSILLNGTFVFRLFSDCG